MTSEETTLEKLRTFANTIATGVTDDELAVHPLEAILENLINAHGPQPIVLNVGDRYYQQSGSRLELNYPFQGDLSLLIQVSKSLNQGQSSGGQSTATFVFDVNHQFQGELADQLPMLLAQLDEELLKDVREANELIDRRQAAFAEELRVLLQPRWKLTRALRSVMEELQVPMTKPAGGRVDVPVRPTSMSMQVIETAAAAGAPQWALAEDRVQRICRYSITWSWGRLYAACDGE